MAIIASTPSTCGHVGDSKVIGLPVYKDLSASLIIIIKLIDFLEKLFLQLNI